VDLMQAQMEKHGDSPMLDSAPLLLREELVFPYGQGMKFIEQLLKHGGRKLAYTGVFENMPRTTREIIQPEEYLAGHRIAPLLLPDMGFLKKDFDPFDAGAMGQLDVSLLMRQYADEATAGRISPEWRGGAYYAAGRKGARPSDPTSTAHIGMIYVSKWSTDKAAQDFAHVYATALPQRYSKLEQVKTGENKSSAEQFTSADGPIFIEQHGEVVVIVESFDEATAGKLIAAALKQVQEKPQAGN
jgi:hypothetical protein